MMACKNTVLSAEQAKNTTKTFGIGTEAATIKAAHKEESNIPICIARHKSLFLPADSFLHPHCPRQSRPGDVVHRACGGPPAPPPPVGDRRWLTRRAGIPVASCTGRTALSVGTVTPAKPFSQTTTVCIPIIHFSNDLPILHPIALQGLSRPKRKNIPPGRLL